MSNSSIASSTRVSSVLARRSARRLPLPPLATYPPTTATRSPTGFSTVPRTSRCMAACPHDPRGIQQLTSQGLLACRFAPIRQSLTAHCPTPNAFFIQYIGLQILEKLIQTRWKAIPDDQRAGLCCPGFSETRDRALTDAPFSFPGIRNFVVSLTIKLASDEMTLRKEKTYINKLNLILVQVRAGSNGLRLPDSIPSL
jgi:hypothetical protein